MTPATCSVPPQDLLAYWLGELDTAREQELEEHWFACAACSERLAAIVALGARIRGVLRGGDFAGVLPVAFLERLKAAGLRLREYTLEPGEAVSCTITPDDDLVVSHLRAPLAGVRRLDVVIDDAQLGTRRLTDVAFDAAAGSLTLVPSAAFLRTLGHEQQRVRLVAVDGGAERALGDYTFDHYPSRRE